MDTVLKTVGLKKYFPTAQGMLHAVDGVDLDIRKGATLGVVGESGCGKSTLGRLVLGLLDATDGEITFNGRDFRHFSKHELKESKRSMQIIFQDPYSSLNPRMSVFQIIAEPLIMNKVCANKTELGRRVLGLMRIVGLDDRFIYAYPHEMDGGRRQRVGIARALALEPEFIVCDEPVSALDVSIQAQILNLLMNLQESMGLTYMFITHDMSVVKHISDEIMVMYLGKCVERAPADELFANPLHPYTQALLSAIPVPKLKADRTRKLIRGEITNPIDPKPGCRFAPRCEHCTAACTNAEIPLIMASPQHYVACTLCGKPYAPAANNL